MKEIALEDYFLIIFVTNIGNVHKMHSLVAKMCMAFYIEYKIYLKNNKIILKYCFKIVIGQTSTSFFS